MNYVVIAAGPTGLAFLYRFVELVRLRTDDQIIILEASDRVGGLAGSVRDAHGFWWDLGGHVTFSHYDYFSQIVDEAIQRSGNGWSNCIRASYVYLQNRFLGYPRQHCYSRHLEQLRPAVLARYERNLQLSHRTDFGRRVEAFLVAHDIAVVHLHTGGDFYGPDYTAKWLQIMQSLPGVRFFSYTRAWRETTIRPLLEQLAQLPNCRIWFSADRGTGLPDVIHPSVHLAWLMTAADDLPPPEASLAFRIRRLRRLPLTRANGVRVCPPEDGVVRRSVVTCERCHLCWKPLPEEQGRRLSLPLLPAQSGAPDPLS